MIQNKHGTIGAPGQELKEIHRRIVSGELIIDDFMHVIDNPFRISTGNEIDFHLMNDADESLYLEVKPWELTCTNIEQVLRYKRAISEQLLGGVQGILCAVIRDDRRLLLEFFDIRIYLIKDCFNIEPEKEMELADYM